MTITTASKNNAEAIKVIPKRHKFFVSMPGEKRAVLTRGQAVALFEELTAIEERHFSWIHEIFDRSLAAADDEVIPPVEELPYAVSIFEKEHSGEDLQMLQAWLKDTLFGWYDPYYRQVTFIKRIRREADELFADFV